MSMELVPYTNFHELNQDWFLNEFNKVIKQWMEMQKNFNNLQDAYNNLYNYVHDYFKNLDVQDEINKKLEDMLKDGTLSNIIGNSINKYIEGNILFSSVPIDRLDLNAFKGEFTTTSFQCCAYNSDNGNILLGFSSLPTASDPDLVLIVLCNSNFDVLTRHTFSVANSHINDATYNNIDKCYYLAMSTTEIVKISSDLSTITEISCENSIYQISYYSENTFYVSYNNTIYSTKDFISYVKLFEQPTATLDNAIYDDIRSCSYQGSEIINGSFVSIMWLYGKDNKPSYCRLYVYVPTADKPKFYDILMSETYDEPECILSTHDNVYVLGYVGNFLTRQIIGINGLLVNRYNLVTIDISHTYNSLSSVPINTTGYLTLSKDISPVPNKIWSSPYECVGYDNRRVIKVYRSNGDIYTCWFDGANWSTWYHQLHAYIGANYNTLNDVPINSSGFFNLDSAISPITGENWSSPYESVGYDNRRVIKVYRSNGDIYTCWFDGARWSGWVKQVRTDIDHTFNSLTDVPVNSCGFFNLPINLSPVSGSTWSAPYECVGKANRRVIKTYRSNGDMYTCWFDGTSWSSWITK